MRRVAILGSTGSIGTSALDVIAANPERFSVAGLAAGRNVAVLTRQIERFRPGAVAVMDRQTAGMLENTLQPSLRTAILYGPDGYRELAAMDGVDVVLSAMSGAAGLLPTLAAIKAGHDVALANKETLVMAGELVLGTAQECGVRILPVDSEHSAVYQCLEGRPADHVQRIILTASGGPFFGRTAQELASVTLKDALKHPNWDMGAKITIDSATMMNKGLEVIEAMRLFSVGVDTVDVVVHPQSIVHSLVAFRDGSLIAQLGIPDMRIPIAYALAYPDRITLPLPDLDLCGMGALTFFQPDMEAFPCLALALEAARRGGTAPAVLNGANERAVEAFVEERIGFVDIPTVVAKTLNSHDEEALTAVEQVLSADRWARQRADEIIAGL